MDMSVVIARRNFTVMAGLDPAIAPLSQRRKKVVDRRVKPVRQRKTARAPRNDGAKMF